MSISQQIVDQMEGAGVSEKTQKRPLGARINTRLRRIVHSAYCPKRRGQTITPTQALHEAFLKFMLQQPVPADAARQICRHIRDALVEHAAPLEHEADTLPNGETSQASGGQGSVSPVSTIDLEQAFQKLDQQDSQMSDILQWYCLLGLTFEEIATLVGLPATAKTMEQKCDFASGYLFNALRCAFQEKSRAAAARIDP